MSLLSKILDRKNKKIEESKDIEPDINTIEEPTDQFFGSSDVMKLYKDTDTVRSPVSTMAVGVRRNNIPPATKFYEVSTITTYAENKDIDTIIIRYDKLYQLSEIKAEAGRFARRSATSIISKFIDVDIYVNINFNPNFIDPMIYSGKKWIRIVYELTDGNTSLSAIKRFPQCMLVEVSETFTKPQLSLDMLIEKGR